MIKRAGHLSLEGGVKYLRCTYSDVRDVYITPTNTIPFPHDHTQSYGDQLSLYENTMI